MHAAHDRVAKSTVDQPSIHGERRDERESERQRETSPEQDVGESSIHGPRHRENDDVVHDLHRRDRHRFGSERNARRAKQRHSGTQERHERQAITEDEGQDDAENDARGVPEAKKRRAPEPKHLADTAPGQAVNSRLKRESGVVRRFGLGVIHPRSSSATAAYGSILRSATRVTAASRRDSPTRPSSWRSRASCSSASTSLRA